MTLCQGVCGHYDHMIVIQGLTMYSFYCSNWLKLLFLKARIYELILACKKCETKLHSHLLFHAYKGLKSTFPQSFRMACTVNFPRISKLYFLSLLWRQFDKAEFRLLNAKLIFQHHLLSRFWGSFQSTLIGNNFWLRSW